MKRRTLTVGLTSLMLSACAPQSQGPHPADRPIATAHGTAAEPASNSEVIARVNGRPITMDQLQGPLLRAYGLNFLLHLVQLEAVEGQAERAGITISQADIQHETEKTLDALPGFEGVKDPSERERLLEQFLTQQRISREEFMLVMRSNAYLRKLAQPLVAGRINDQTLKEAFNQQYGETVQVRHIQLANLSEVAEAKRRLAAGETFEQVARELSRNPRTAGLGGELPPFTRNRPDLPEAFREAAFSLKPGDVSDPVQAEGAFHLIKLERRIPPKAVKFDDVKESLERDLTERLTQATMAQLRQELAQQAIQTLQIDNPILKQEYEKRRDEQEATLKDREQVRQDLERRHDEFQKRQNEQAIEPTTGTSQPSTDAVLPQTAPSTAQGTSTDEIVQPAVEAQPTTQAVPSTQPGELRPPATMSGD